MGLVEGPCFAQAKRPDQSIECTMLLTIVREPDRCLDRVSGK